MLVDCSLGLTFTIFPFLITISKAKGGENFFQGGGALPPGPGLATALDLDPRHPCLWRMKALPPDPH